ncbi:MAG: type I DNA topoisomerase [Peptostreptococcaceae bacterium]
MAKTLVIVESPAKAKTIEKFLGKSHYIVKASVGHIRDLPKSRLAVDIENNFEPDYINIRGKGDIIKDLKKEAKKAKKIYLATDPDREGEAISWHLAHILGIEEDENCRIEFNEITKDAIKKAIKIPRNIDIDLVDAQQARRVLDRLLGYQISPILWEKVRKGLSAGRVQSVATKIICDREKEIEAFIPREYWTVDLDTKNTNNENINFKLHIKEENKFDLNTEEKALKVVNELKNEDLIISSVESKSRKKSAPKPFTTSMLQQEAYNKLGFATKKTMKVAQELYEGIDIEKETVGLISYIRTDSKRISDEAKKRAKSYITEFIGENYYKEVVDKENKKAKKVQDAHEAIRPTYVEKTPDEIKDYLSKDQFKLYNLIWRRFVSSQMEDSVFDILTVESKIKNHTLRASGSKLKFDGYTKIYNFSDREDKILPSIEVGEKLEIENINKNQHFTNPPARYTEASLVKTLEEQGIGRPSTYSPTISTILAREYVKKEASSLYPTELGKVVTDILENNFQKFIDVDFTASMESELDKIEEGEVFWKDVVSKSYEPLKEAIETAIDNIEKVNMDEKLDEICEICGEHMYIKHGRFGKFIACKSYPECKNTRPILNKIGVKCQKCEVGDILLRKSKKGKAFYGCSDYPTCDFISWDKPTDVSCEKCGCYMVEKTNKKGTKFVCSDKECKFSIEKED